MATSSANLTHGSVALRPVRLASPWDAVLLPVSVFPVLPAEIAPVKQFLQRLVPALSHGRLLTSEVVIQISQLHLGDGHVRMTAHGKDWLPMPGLGVWPDREPPTLWTPEYFASLGVGETPRPVMNVVLRVTTTPEARESARNIMLGLATVLQILTPDDSDTFLKKAKAALHPAIKDPAFTSFPFYVPLLDSKSLAKATAAQLDSWFCDASVYIRESVEDAGVLIASREPLGPILQGLGGKLQPDPDAEWRIPA